MAISKDRRKTLDNFVNEHPHAAHALCGWIALKNKPYRLMDVLDCLYEASNERPTVMLAMIEHLTAKNKTFGRTQVHGSGNRNNLKMDIVKGRDGQLEVVNYDPGEALPLKGQVNANNRNIYRKSDNQVSKTYQNAERRINDLGWLVRQILKMPNAPYSSFGDPEYETMQNIRSYAADKKLSAVGVANAILNGKLGLSKSFMVVPNVRAESRTYFITEDQSRILRESLDMTEYRFNSNVRRFLHDLLIDPVGAQVPDALRLNGLNRSRLIAYLVRGGILEKDERIRDTDSDGNMAEPMMATKYRVPKRNFDRNMKKLYIRLFERNVPEPSRERYDEMPMTEDEGGMAGTAGTTNCASSGQFSQPVFPIQRRKIYGGVEEDTTTSSAGDYQYTVPFPGDKETLARKNGVGGSVSVNRIP